MAQMYGKASEYLQKKISNYRTVAFIVSGLFFVIVFYILEHFREIISPKGYLLVIPLVPLVILLNFIGNKSLDKSSSYSRGKQGEGTIWYELKSLSGDYCIFQDIKMDSGGNIDFVILGPVGLFALEVKSHTGDVTFNGHELEVNSRPFERDLLKQAKGEALFINNYLKAKVGKDIFVQPVGVFSGNATMHFGLKPVNGVYVIQKNFLQKLITAGVQRFSAEEVSRIKNELKALVAG
jgi:hypothetical protein